MSRGRSWVAIVLVGATAILAWIITKKTAPPEVDFTKAIRETIVSTLGTNGKVEPIEWLPARAERAGVVTRVFITKGQQVKKNAPLVELDTRISAAELSKAEAAIQEAKTQESVLDQGGRVQERQQVDADLSRAKLDLGAAEKQVSALERLVSKKAATQVELDNARQLVDQLQLRIKALEAHKAALVTGPDKAIARAKLLEAESAASVARVNLDLSVVRAPMEGVAYEFDLRRGSFVNPGDLIAKVGRIDRVRVMVYVDEPDLGKVRKGELVTITWEAKPGHQWKGEVDKLPTQVVPLGTRQVGEVGCVIENPDRDLLPSANIDANIQATVVPNALTVPKEAIRRQGSETGVLLLEGNRVAWRKVSLGVSSYTRTQVLSGLNEGDGVALPAEKPIKSGSKVEAVFP
ncbi:MAG TPA: efflux RND transporter periplasmic adaptor subunit [Bryobacteraceae bacterium]|nr:efflux RND transporter periplasmic adaptor subunit [Bryobacteraceae bacterium]